MNDLSAQLSEMADAFMDEDQVTYADICYEASRALTTFSAESMHVERKLSEDKVLGTLLDEMALQ